MIAPFRRRPRFLKPVLALVQHNVRHSESAVLKDDLMRSVWPDTFVEESNLAQNIRRISTDDGKPMVNNRKVNWRI
jgi:hypothetical protein